MKEISRRNIFQKYVLRYLLKFIKGTAKTEPGKNGSLIDFISPQDYWDEYISNFIEFAKEHLNEDGDDYEIINDLDVSKVEVKVFECEDGECHSDDTLVFIKMPEPIVGDDFIYMVVTGDIESNSINSFHALLTPSRKDETENEYYEIYFPYYGKEFRLDNLSYKELPDEDKFMNDVISQFL